MLTDITMYIMIDDYDTWCTMYAGMRLKTRKTLMIIILGVLCTMCVGMMT